MENQEVAKVEAQLPAVPAQSMSDLGMSEQDVMIDRLLLMQATSELVGDEVQKIGDVVLNNTGEEICQADGQIEVIPLRLFKTWRVMDMTKKPPEFLREEPMTSANEKAEWEFTEVDEHGKQAERRRDYGLHFFVLLANQLESFPVLVSFRRTSVKAGKALATILFKQAALKKPVYGKTAILSVGKDKFQTNTYAFWQVKPGNPTTPEGLQAARDWAEPREPGKPALIEALKSRVDWSRDRDTDAQGNAAPAAAPVVVTDEAPGTSASGPY